MVADLELRVAPVAQLLDSVAFPQNSVSPGQEFTQTIRIEVQWMLDLADTGLAENFGLKDTLQKIRATFFYFST